MPLLLFLYVRFVDGYECWGGFTKRGFENWWPMVRACFLSTIMLENVSQPYTQIKLSIPGLVMVEAEFLAFEMLTLLSSYFSTAHLAAQSVLVTATSITFQLGFALSIASSTRVANFLGATLEDAAKTAAHTGFIAAGFIGLFNFCLMTSISNRFVLLFTDDPEIVGYVVQVMPLTALFQCVDAISTMGSGLLRGQGTNTLYHCSFFSFFFFFLGTAD